MDPSAVPRRPPPSPGAPQVVFVIILLFWLFAGPTDQPGQINGTYGPQFRAGQILTQQDLWNERICVLRGQLDVLRNTTHGPLGSHEVSLYVNLTGLREKDGYAWDILDDVKDRARKVGENAIGIVPKILSRRDAEEVEEANVLSKKENAAVKKEYAPKSFYQNATGTVRGTWVQSNMFDQRVEEKLKYTREIGLNLTELAPDTSWSGLDVMRNITGREGKMRLSVEDDGREITGTWNNVTGMSNHQDD